ncbi:MAG: hypothetical protein ACXAC6_14050 [Candidatus Hodarchaeales archaeon]|jgi:hypothetical protein
MVSSLNKRKMLIILLISIFLLSFSSSKALGCTNFKITLDSTVLFGNSEDQDITVDGVYITFVPSAPGQFGAVHVGYDNIVASWVQGGMNDQGLAYDSSSVPFVNLNPHSNRLSYPKLMGEVFLETCANVTDVIDVFNNYRNILVVGNVQWFFADKTGESLTVSPGLDGEWKFSRNTENVDVISNINIQHPEMGDLSNAEARVSIASGRLSEIISENNTSIESVSEALDLVHQEGAETNTIYSNIFDVTNGIIYLYYFHQFEEVIQLNLQEELALGNHAYQISSLFSQEIHKQVSIELNEYRRVFPFDIILFLSVLMLNLCIFIVFLNFGIKKSIRYLTYKKKPLSNLPHDDVNIGKNKQKQTIILALSWMWTCLSLPMIHWNYIKDWSIILFREPFFDTIGVFSVLGISGVLMIIYLSTDNLLTLSSLKKHKKMILIPIFQVVVLDSIFILLFDVNLARSIDFLLLLSINTMTIVSVVIIANLLRNAQKIEENVHIKPSYGEILVSSIRMSIGLALLLLPLYLTLHNSQIYYLGLTMNFLILLVSLIILTTVYWEYEEIQSNLVSDIAI